MGQSVPDPDDTVSGFTCTKGATVTVSAVEFKSWLAYVSLSPSPSALSAATGINRGTIRNQLLRGSIAEATVVSIARAYQLNVVDSLGYFTPYADLASRVIIPKPYEVMSQIHVADLMAELQSRQSEKHFPRKLRSGIDFIDLPHDGSVRSWIDAIDLGDIRKAMAQETGVNVTYIANQLSENKLNPALALAASRAGKVSLGSGFVVTGVIRPEEGGWPVRAREEALLEVSDEVLVDLIAARIRVLQRKVSQRKEAMEYAEKMTEILG